MASDQAEKRPSIVPSLRYYDAPAAIEWLCRAFGFEKQLVVPGEEEGTVIHAQLVRGGAMLMLGSSDSHGGNEFDRRVRPAADLDGKTNQAIYLVVEDADAHYAQALKAGAEIVMEIEDAGYGGRGYTCLDLDGNVWSFGTYDPWTE
ncbi:MAG: VOC family protein [Myxococcota bacterium]|nr:VOC family protein [Myxococcota bacterium]